MDHTDAMRSEPGKHEPEHTLPFDPKASDKLKGLYPTLTKEELKQAEAALRRYFECAWDVVTSTTSHTGVGFDNPDTTDTMKERSKVSFTT